MNSKYEEIYKWVDGHSISRAKKYPHRTFADAIPLAEILKNYYPKLVDMYNYTPKNSMAQKMVNWERLNRKVLNKIKINLTKFEMQELAGGTAGAIERLLIKVKTKIEKNENSPSIPLSENNFSVNALGTENSQNLENVSLNALGAKHSQNLENISLNALGGENFHNLENVSLNVLGAENSQNFENASLNALGGENPQNLENLSLNALGTENSQNLKNVSFNDLGAEDSQNMEKSQNLEKSRDIKNLEEIAKFDELKNNTTETLEKTDAFKRSDEFKRSDAIKSSETIQSSEVLQTSKTIQSSETFKGGEEVKHFEHLKISEPPKLVSLNIFRRMERELEKEELLGSLKDKVYLMENLVTAVDNKIRTLTDQLRVVAKSGEGEKDIAAQEIMFTK